MDPWPPRSRAPEYRERAAEVRLKADDMTDPEARRAMLATADVWDRMADWEEKNPRPPN